VKRHGAECFNVLGETIDLKSHLEKDVRRDPIHRFARLFDELSSNSTILETVFKVIDFVRHLI